jgi:hypothetical protein
MRYRRIAKQHRHFCYTQTLIVQQVFGMLHTLRLVKIKYSSAEYFFEPLFKIALIDSGFAAQLLNGNGFANMLP